MTRWNLERWLSILTFIGVVISIVFGLGVQWARTTAVEASLTAVSTAMKQDYVRADVYAADQRRLTEAIDRLTRALEASHP